MDADIIHQLTKYCECSYSLDNGVCYELSFHSDDNILGGTFRHNTDKDIILSLIGELHHLKSLNIRKCRIGRVPRWDMPFLQYLDLSCNQLPQVPDWVYDLKHLKFLNLGSNRIHSIESIPPDLETLKVHKNFISSLPPLPKSIKFLNLYLNRLRFMPVLDLPHLEFLSFGATDVREIPPLPSSLRWLTLVANKLVYLPDNFTQLINLEGARLAKNQIKCLPYDIGNMSLRELSLYSNALESLPESFYLLKLSKLNLSKNRLNDTARVVKSFAHIEYFEC